MSADPLQQVVTADNGVRQSGPKVPQRAVTAEAEELRRRIYVAQDARKKLQFEIGTLERRERYLELKERVLTHRLWVLVAPLPAGNDQSSATAKGARSDV